MYIYISTCLVRDVINNPYLLLFFGGGNIHGISIACSLPITVRFHHDFAAAVCPGPSAVGARGGRGWGGNGGEWGGGERGGGGRGVGILVSIF